MRLRAAFFLYAGLAIVGEAANFTIINGQIFTPGLAIVDAPQPNTPLGGDTLQVALDVSGDGKIPLPPYQDDQPTGFYNITIFLTSVDTGLNLTISNGTASSGNASVGDIMSSEPGSTVKHVNWKWPSCLVGNGFPKDSSSSRGAYNISIHQNFKLNDTNYYTIFDLPISVTNEISQDSSRPSCDVLANKLQSQADQDASADIIPPSKFPWTNGQGTQTVVPAPSSGSNGGSSTGSSSSSTSTPDIGGQKPDAQPSNGLGSSGTSLVIPDLLVPSICAASSLILLFL